MAVKFQTGEKPFVRWTVDIPCVGKSNESPNINLENQNWCFLMMTKLNELRDETWTMYFMKKLKADMPSKFVLTAYVCDNNFNNVYLTACKGIINYETEIWSCSRSSFFHSYPEIKCVGNELTFFFTMMRTNQNWKDLKKEDKSVQAPDPLYLDDRLCLENLSLDLRKLMEDSLPDVQLKCGDCILPAHKLILGVRSKVFCTMLQSDMSEGRNGSVEIDDMEPTVFEIFIRYLYSGTLPELSEDIAMPLYEAGDKYDVLALKMRCGDFLAENLSRESCCRIIATADAHSDNSLKDRVILYMLNEKVPNNDKEWLKFCSEYPKLAIEVLNRAYKQLNCSHYVLQSP